MWQVPIQRENSDLFLEVILQLVKWQRNLISVVEQKLQDIFNKTTLYFWWYSAIQNDISIIVSLPIIPAVSCSHHKAVSNFLQKYDVIESRRQACRVYSPEQGPKRKRIRTGKASPHVLSDSVGKRRCPYPRVRVNILLIVIAFLIAYTPNLSLWIDNNEFL